MKRNMSQRRKKATLLIGVFSVVLFSILSLSVHGQGWVIEGAVDINHVDCGFEQINSGSISLSSSSLGTRNFTMTSVDGPIAYGRLAVDNTLDPSGNIFISGDGSCIEAYPCFEPLDNCPPPPGYISANAGGSVAFNKSQCGSYYVPRSSAAATVSGQFYFYPRLDITKFSNSCSGVITISAMSACFNSLIWEVQDSDGNYHIIPGKTSETIVVTADELQLNHLQKYGVRNLRISDADRPGRTSLVKSFNVHVPSPTISFTITNPKCHGDTDGKINVSIASADPSLVDHFAVNLFKTGGSGFPIVHNVHGFSDEFTGLSQGDYWVTVDNNTDPDNLGFCGSSTGTIPLTTPTAMTFTTSVPLHTGYAISCNSGINSSNGAITINPSGGTGPPYNFIWKKNGVDYTSGNNLSSISGLSAGNYTMSFTDGMGCSADNNSTPVNISAPGPISLIVNPLKPFRGYAVKCANTNEGVVTAIASGGVAGFNYGWSTGETGSTGHNLSASTSYTVTVTDQNLCPATSLPILLDPPPPIEFSLEVTNPSCHDEGDAEVKVKNIILNSGAVTFSWSVDPIELTSVLSGQVAGVGTAIVTDQLGCSTTNPYTIADPPEFTATLQPLSNFNGSFIQCNGNSNGEIGAKLYTNTGVETMGENFTWYKNGINFTGGPSVTSIDQLDEGLYKVAVSYNDHCIAEQTFDLHDPDPIDVNIIATSDYHGQPISCNDMTDASLAATATGGTGTLTYTWNTGIIGSSLTNVGASDYSVIVKDVNHCEGLTSTTLVDPLPVHAMITSLSDYHGFGVSCFGSSDGTITALGSGGTGVYNYLWNDGPSGSSRTSLTTGSYSVTVTDNNGCDAAIEQIITTPLAVTISVANKEDISCHAGTDGEVELLAAGGAGQYEYSINSGTNWQSQPVFSSLVATGFSFLVRDVNLCAAYTSTTLTEPDALQLSFTNILPAFCANPVGEATAVANGGVENYVYEWTNVSNQNVGADIKMTGVPAGIYTLKVTDSHACEIMEQVPITSTDGAKSTWTSVDTKCFDSADGSAAVTITAGDGPFLIAWPDGQSALHGVNLKKGNYFVQITDVHDCAVVETVTIQGPNPITMSVTNMKIPTCFGSSDGEISLAAAGGVGSYSFSWNNKTTASQDLLAAGDYAVRITDANQCVLNQTVQLTQPADLSAQIIKSVLPTCHDGCDGVLQVLASGGNGGYEYQWGSFSKISEIKNICPGNHPLKITDGKGCVKDMTIALGNTPLPALDLGGGITLCVGQTYTLNAGDNWKSYSWKGSNGLSSNQQRVVVKEAGEYTLEVTTKDGCVAKDIFLLETSLDLLKASFLLPHEADVGDTVVFIDISWPLPETISWNFPGAMQKIYDMNEIVLGQFHKDGVYDIGLTANLGECRDYINKSITILKGIETEVPGGRLGYEEYVKDFIMYPNPTDGDFEIGIELAEEAPVTLSVWNSATGVLMRKVDLTGNNIYKAKFDLRPLGFGTYVIRLDHKKGKEYLRFVVH